MIARRNLYLPALETRQLEHRQTLWTRMPSAFLGCTLETRDTTPEGVLRAVGMLTSVPARSLA